MNKLNILYNKLQADKLYLIILSLLTFCFLFVFSKMSPLYPCNEWSDINVYYTIGKSMMNGKVPYLDIFDHKGPLIFVIYGLGYLISPISFLGIFLIQLVCWLILTLSVFYIARLFLDKTSSFFIALLVPFSMLSFMHTGGAAEEFIVIFATLSLLLFLRFWTKDRTYHDPTSMFVHGLLCGVTLFIKLNLLLFWVFPLLAIFLQLLNNKYYTNIWKNILTYLLGFSIVFIPVIAYFWIHNGLDDLYFVYIGLNKKYAIVKDYYLLAYEGTNRLKDIFIDNLLWFSIIFVGVFYFPIKYLKNNLAKVALILSGISLIGMVFYTASYQFYYPLTLYVYIVLGLIPVFGIIKKYLSTNHLKKVGLLFAVIVAVISIKNHNLTELLNSSYLKDEYLKSPHFRFRTEISEKKNPTLLSVTFGRSCALFTTCNITPNIKYFITPNISYDSYPIIRDTQTEYIKNKKIDFIISSTRGRNYEYFETLPELTMNYNKIDSVAEGETIYFLYKKREY